MKRLKGRFVCCIIDVMAQKGVNMKKTCAALLIVALFLAPELAFAQSSTYYRGYERGHELGVSQGAADKEEGLKYKPWGYKYFKEMYIGKPYNYRSGFKNGYKRGYKDAYKGELMTEEIIIERRIVVE